MNFDRCVAIVNLFIVASGSAWAMFEWYPTYETQTTTLDKLRIELGADRQVPFEYDGKLVLTDLKTLEDGSHLYSVEYDISTRNLSKAQIAISYSVAELYLGSAGYDELHAVGDVMLVNDPPDPWHPDESGWVKWTRVAYEASIADGDRDPKVASWLHTHYPHINHNGLTAILPTGTDTTYHPRFIIRAKLDQYVGVVVTFGVNDVLDVTKPDVGLIYETRYLGDAAQPAAAEATSRTQASAQPATATLHDRISGLAAANRRSH